MEFLFQKEIIAKLFPRNSMKYIEESERFRRFKIEHEIMELFKQKNLME
jgi:hypothetical protein